jgi:plastocyanin
LDDPPTRDPAPDPNAPTPMQVIISIVGSFGGNAFMPNPIQANVGDMLVWTNNDSRLHHIVLDDGSDLGDVAPGQSSAPMVLTTPSANFHCTIHPSMVGSINGNMTPPVYAPPPPDDYYGY